LVFNLTSNDTVRADLACVSPDPVVPCDFRRARLGPLFDGTTRAVLETTLPTNAGSDDATGRILDFCTGIMDKDECNVPGPRRYLSADSAAEFSLRSFSVISTSSRSDEPERRECCARFSWRPEFRSPFDKPLVLRPRIPPRGLPC
jgi:hypothetical protein